MTDIKTQTITEAIDLEFVDAKGAAVVFSSDLVFDAADPYAVTMVFRTGEQEVAWTFGRDLLVEGRYEPVGDGDVHVWPCLGSSGSAVTIIELCSPDGEVMVQADARAIDKFVDAMLSVVPMGGESALLDFDAELAALLS